MRTVLIVVISPYFQLFLRILQGDEPVGVEALFPKASVERFDVSVIDWRTWSREYRLDLPVIGSGIQCPGDKLRAIIHLNAFGGSALLGNMLEDRTGPSPLMAFSA